jgi:uncharacterized protein (TIGR03000 family)
MAMRNFVLVLGASLVSILAITEDSSAWCHHKRAYRTHGYGGPAYAGYQPWAPAYSGCDPYPAGYGAPYPAGPIRGRRVAVGPYWTVDPEPAAIVQVPVPDPALAASQPPPHADSRAAVRADVQEPRRTSVLASPQAAGLGTAKGEPVRDPADNRQLVRTVLSPDSGKKSSQAAHVTVTLPAEAKLFVQGVACPLTSAKRTFDTPKLQVGQNYIYTLRAEVARAGRTLVETRQVSITAGKRVVVDFGDMSAAKVAAGPAQVTVLLPEEAKLLVQGMACPLTSGKRTFSSPQLQAGQSYTYTLQAEVIRVGQSITESRRVTLAAGQRVVVDFGNLSRAQGEGVAAAR